MCEEAVLLIAITLMIAGHVAEAIWVLVQYDAYERKHDMEQFCPTDVVQAQGAVARLFGVATRGESAKTGSGQGVVLRRSVATELILAMRDHALRSNNARVFALVPPTMAVGMRPTRTRPRLAAPLAPSHGAQRGSGAPTTVVGGGSPPRRMAINGQRALLHKNLRDDGAQGADA